MNSEDLIKFISPIAEMAGKGAIVAQALMKHYVKTISNLTGKPVDEIQSELSELIKEIQEKEAEKLKGNSSETQNKE